VSRPGAPGWISAGAAPGFYPSKPLLRRAANLSIVSPIPTNAKVAGSGTDVEPPAMGPLKPRLPESLRPVPKSPPFAQSLIIQPFAVVIPEATLRDDPRRTALPGYDSAMKWSFGPEGSLRDHVHVDMTFTRR